MTVPAYHGIFAPNMPMRPEHWLQLGLTGAQWVKLLQEDHSPGDAAAAKAAGLRVIVRAKGEGIVYEQDVARIITEYRGVCDIIECGNEPWPTRQFPTWDLLWWNNAYMLAIIAANWKAAAHAAGMQLFAPAWHGGDPVPVVGAHIPATDGGPAAYTFGELLVTRLNAVYSMFDGYAIHTYDPWDLTTPAPQAHLAAWAAWMPQKPFLLSEYGIAGPLAPEEKAGRYARFLQGLAPYGARLVAATAFLLDGTLRYTQPPEDYVLPPAGWRALGAALAR